MKLALAAALSKKDRFLCLQANSPAFYLTSLAIITTLFFFFHLLPHYTTFDNNNPALSVRTNKGCDLFRGRWVRFPRGPVYTNYSCKTIPDKRNCFLHARKDSDFLNWRWKPDECELRRFDPRRFLSVVRGKKMAFIGDSLARNQMDSLLCLLSTVETPKQIEMPKEPKLDVERASTTWNFFKHNFTVMTLWSQFLVDATEIVVNGTATGNFHLQLDKVDTSWSEKLPSIDYAIFSDVHWFFRQNMLYEGGNHVADIGLYMAIKKAIRTTIKAINDCKNCRKISTLLRTYSPSHFENGEWNTGGTCNRTQPIGKEEMINIGDLGVRNAQVEEIQAARNASVNKFEVIDVTEMMLIRPDGHPGVYQGKAWMKGYSDCVHWCLPGPIDTWNELLLELIARNI